MPEQKRPAPSTSLPKICRTVGECFAGVLIPLTPIFASVLPILLAVYLGYRMLHSGFDDTVAGALLASEYVANKLVIPTWLASIAFLVSLGQNSAAYTCNWTGLMCGDVGRDKILDKNDSNAFKTMKDQRFALVNALATLPANVEHTFVPHDLFDRCVFALPLLVVLLIRSQARGSRSHTTRPQPRRRSSLSRRYCGAQAS